MKQSRASLRVRNRGVARLIFGSVLASAIGLATICLPRAASAQSPSPATSAAAATGPIHIDSCNVQKINSQMGFGNLFLNGKGYNFFNITFTNTAQVAVKRIVFQVEFDKSRYVLGDDGTFAPGAQITHHLRDHGKDVHAFARAGTGPTVCTVLSATLADGTTWSPPVASPAPAPTAT